MFTNNNNFYPTPIAISDKLFNMLPFDELGKSHYILEPSTGKGDLVENFKKTYARKFYIRSLEDIDKYLNFECIEIDKNLRNLLKGKKYNLVAEDFLTFIPNRFYDLILMNPPFDRGCDHLLKAVKIQERIGGKILCMLNAETLKNPYSNNRKKLIQLLTSYKANIQYIQDGFKDAERITDVEIALIYINIPMKNSSTMFEKKFKQDNADMSFEEFNTLVPNMNKLEKLIMEYEIVKKSMIELFKEKLRIENLFNSFNIQEKIIIGKDTSRLEEYTINTFIDDLNMKYWEKFINETEFKKRLPSKLRNNFNYNMERQKNIAFNMENIKYFYDELINSIPKSYEETVAEVFDKLTYKHAYTDSTWNKTIHYYDGWKTNNCYRINKKVIIPCYHENYFYHLPDSLIDLNIIFENIAGEKDNIDTKEIKKAIEFNKKGIETKFFKLDSYKKGTLHINFKEKKYLDIFNILAGKGKQWLPPDFGEKSYNDMSKEELKMIEGLGMSKEEYSVYTHSNNNDYLRLASGV